MYGSPGVHRELIRRGEQVCRNTVARVMRVQGIKARTHRRFRVRTTDARHPHPIAPNTLGRGFACDRLDRVWLTDITYIPTGEGLLHLAGVMDLCSRRIIGWSMKDTLATELVEAAFDMAFLSRQPSAGLLHHSDRGCQYASGGYRARLREAGIEMSMSRAGNCYDNAMIESFWGKLKAEMVNHRKFATREEARVATFEYIEMFYNRKRLHAALGYVSPVQFEERLVA